MRFATTKTAPEIAHGVIQSMDVIDRKVSIWQESGLTTYLVSANCEVLLNGERVKLRLLQRRDHVRIAYWQRNDVRLALSLEVMTRRAQWPSVNSGS